MTDTRTDAERRRDEQEHAEAKRRRRAPLAPELRPMLVRDKATRKAMEQAARWGR